MTDPHGRLVLELERVLAAAPERVFEMLTEPTELATWWGPRLHDAGDPARPRRRRTYRVTMQPPDGEAFHLSGDFLEVHPPDRLSFTFRWDEPDPDDRETVVVLLLAPRGAATALSSSLGDFATEERLELHRNGWAESFDKLEAALRGRSSEPRT